MNPEELLKEVTTAIKHRCISKTERWHIVYYYNRICCVPSYENVPPEIILAVLTEHQAQNGLATKHWNDIKFNITKIYKELHK